MEKLTRVLKRLEEQPVTKGLLKPVFVSIDPQRDTKEVIKDYLQGIFIYI